MESINYVIAAYLGDRHFMDPRFRADRWYYLRQQVEMLARLRHGIAQTTIVINSDVPLTVPQDILDSGAVVYQRANTGMSYGAYADAFNRYGTAFTHFILNEDDYLFTQDNFDSLLLSELQGRPGCGMLCGAAYEIGAFPVHPAVSCMIATADALRVLAGRHGGLLPHFHTAGKDPYPDAYQAQASFGYAMVQAGYTLEDWLLRWSTAYRQDGLPDLGTRWFSRRGMATGNPHGIRADFTVPSMIVSAQAVDIRHPIHDGFGTVVGTIRKNGTVEF